MYGLLLQILGQYQGLLRNFCDRSQRVSPFWMTYSSGAPGTGLRLVSGGGRGPCSVTTGAVSGRCCCSCAGAPSDSAAMPARAALRQRAIVFVRMDRLLKTLQELPRGRRFDAV